MKIYETLESGIKIVEYEPSLAAGIAEMWNLSSDDWGGSGSLKTASQIISEHETASFFNVYIAMDGDTVVGYCSFARYFYDADTTYVYLLGVRPDYKGKKIGKALVLRCVQRTIELGYPRVDLYTWAGNTDAVPLYKKCGFMWEDRPDSVHLANYIPTIITTPLFADFFKKADWYADSTRSMDITPDGVEVNKFELFTYTWEKDGDMLAVGFERSGRQMRMIETADYKIELMAQDHALAFGTDYDCEFVIENKTGKPLNVKIAGREDKNIKFDYRNDINVVGNVTLPTKFHVGETDEIQDAWKIHPCLLADVEINGQTVTFGMGIEAKFPIVVNLHRECTVDQVGMDVETHIGVSGSLLEDAHITISIPESRLLDIKQRIFTVDVPAKGKASVKTMATTLDIGFESLKLDCTATLKNGATFNFKTPLFIYTRDMTHAFSAEDLYNYNMFNGPWELALSKSDENEVSLNHRTNRGGFPGNFDAPKFGKPYDDEFNLLKPNVKMYQQGTVMIMEAEYVSEKFPGMVATQIYTMSAVGLITCVSKVENRSGKTQHVMLQSGHYMGIYGNTVYSYKGQITQNFDTPKANGHIDGLSGINPDYFDENWVFEASPTHPKGYCWPAEYKPAMKWGGHFSFEIDPGKLAPGQVFVSKPVVYALGLFSNYNDFRNYARQIYNTDPMVPTYNVDVVLNGYNPFIVPSATDVKLEVINNREQVLEGTIHVSSSGVFADTSQTNPEEEVVERNTFDLSMQGGKDIQLATIALNTIRFEKNYTRAMFFPMGEIVKTQEGTNYSVSNGAITFKADPVYGNVCYSLTDKKGQEWLLSKYPNHEPFSWFNPFLGGIRVNPPGTYSAVTILKEKRTADFAEMRDNFGNVWQGICLTLEVNEFEKYKGAIYKNYFMTLPGLPVLCTFFQFENGTGEYKSDTVTMGSYLSPDDDAKNVVIEATTKNRMDYRFRMGSEDLDELNFENLLTMSSSRKEKLYMFHGNKHNKKLNYFWANNDIPVTAGTDMTVSAAAGGTFTSSPLFFIVSDKDLTSGALDDLERIRFN